MSIFGVILSKILGHAEAAPGAAPAPAGPTPAAPASLAPPTQAAVQAVSPATPVPPARIDVEAVLTALASKNPEKLNWQSSIVDLLKLLDLDSSLRSRIELAGELHYPGDTGDSATMNIWLHQEVMQKLEENGGKVPADLKA